MTHTKNAKVAKIKVCIICAKPVPDNDAAWMPALDYNGDTVAQFKVHTKCRKARGYV
ncbi:MAG: hypothetical protein QOI07_900 [Verrucomicrobiota bacterium]|jgi:hypothetical protein